MTTTDLLKFHEKMCSDARSIMAQKNHDYAGADGDTPFANFTASEKLGICSTETGFLMRMLDKLQRLSTFAKAGALKVLTEGPRDACLDIINYAILLAAYIHQKQERKNEHNRHTASIS